jgi:hypothetical protein
LFACRARACRAASRPEFASKRRCVHADKTIAETLHHSVWCLSCPALSTATIAARPLHQCRLRCCHLLRCMRSAVATCNILNCKLMCQHLSLHVQARVALLSCTCKLKGDHASSQATSNPPEKNVAHSCAEKGARAFLTPSVAQRIDDEKGIMRIVRSGSRLVHCCWTAGSRRYALLHDQDVLCT